LGYCRTIHDKIDLLFSYHGKVNGYDLDELMGKASNAGIGSKLHAKYKDFLLREDMER
jgi:hypothetical protein